MTDIRGLTADYEAWLGQRIPLVGDDLAAKHVALAATPLRFLRGTYYLWLHDMSRQLPELLRRPVVPSIGDLHVENFGTWSDADGVRRFGVNDLDELSWGSYAVDLVRLATSAVLVPALALTPRELCATLLEHWMAAVPGAALDLSTPAARHLEGLAPQTRTAAAYYAALRAGPPADPPDDVAAAVESSVDGAWQPQWFARRAGTGSLGHPRVVAVGVDERGLEQAREAKLLGPLTRDWPHAGAPPGRADPALYAQVMRALRGPDGAARVVGWQLRRLAPDVARIDLAGLHRGAEKLLLRSMAQACADVHGYAPEALRAAQAAAAGQDEHWLHEATREMTARTLAAHDAWRAHAGSTG
jgi:hypothetical protein